MISPSDRCSACGYMPDTPNHEIGCVKGISSKDLGQDIIRLKRELAQAKSQARCHVRRGARSTVCCELPLAHPGHHLGRSQAGRWFSFVSPEWYHLPGKARR